MEVLDWFVVFKSWIQLKRYQAIEKLQARMTDPMSTKI